MYLDHRAIQRIARVLDNIENKALLMDEQGNVLYPEGDQRRLTLPEAVLKNPTEPLIYGGVTLIGIKVEHSPRDDSPLFLCLDGDNRDVRSCARLCAELISVTLKAGIVNADRAQALRIILRGEGDISELESLAVAHSIPTEQERCVICIYSRTLSSEAISKKLDGLIDAEKDMYTDLSRNSLALVKTLPTENGFDDLRNAAAELDAAFVEAQLDVVIGVSDPRRKLTELSEALGEAREAMNVGSIYRAGERLFIYRRLMLERFLHTVPRNSGMSYGSMVFNARTARLFNEEMIHTIEVFFENNLNLSEAARKLYIHRNTLVYRLEKVQRITGFDLREFDDAVTFKLMMLISRNANSVRSRI